MLCRHLIVDTLTNASFVLTNLSRQSKKTLSRRSEWNAVASNHEFTIILCTGKLHVFISITRKGSISARQNQKKKKQWHRVIIMYASAITSRWSHGRSFVRFVVCKCRGLQPRIVRRLVGYSLIFYNATDAKRARPGRHRRGLAGRPPQLFRLEINTAVDAPLLRRSLPK